MAESTVVKGAENGWVRGIKGVGPGCFVRLASVGWRWLRRVRVLRLGELLM